MKCLMSTNHFVFAGFAEVGGGAVAGYLDDGGTWDGVRLGLCSGIVATVIVLISLLGGIAIV